MVMEGTNVTADNGSVMNLEEMSELCMLIKSSYDSPNAGRSEMRGV